MRYEIHHTRPEARRSTTTTSSTPSSTHWPSPTSTINDLLHLGPIAGNMLEVVTLDIGDEVTTLVIHAMKMRPKYRTLLRGLGEPDA